MRGLLIIGVFVLMAALGGCSPEPPATSEQAFNPVAPSEPEEQMMMEGAEVKLRLWDERQEPGVAQLPLVEVDAQKANLLYDRTWAIEDAVALIRNQKGDEGEEITLKAKEGTVDEGKGAVLRGGVVAYAGNLTMTMDDIEWQNPTAETPGQAWTNNKVLIQDANMDLEAHGLHIYPENQQFVLKNVSGIIRIGRD